MAAGDGESRARGCHTETVGFPRSPSIAGLIDGQVNRDAPHNETPRSSLRRRPQPAAGCRRRVLRVGARAGPARAAARAVPAVLAEQDLPGSRGARWLQSGRYAGTGLRSLNLTG